MIFRSLNIVFELLEFMEIYWVCLVYFGCEDNIGRFVGVPSLFRNFL
jgi:hypothetical protein